MNITRCHIAFVSCTCISMAYIFFAAMRWVHLVCINASKRAWQKFSLFCCNNWSLSCSPAACFMMSTWSSNCHQTLLTVLSHNCINVLLNIKRISAHPSGPIHLRCLINIVGPLVPAPPALPVRDRQTKMAES